jgi:hypothetical protein
MGASKPKAIQAPRLSGDLAQAQSSSIASLQRQAAGKGPSVTREQLKAAQERTLASQLAAAQARPKGNPALAMRQLIAERGESGREMAQAAAIGQAQEAQGARAALVGMTEADLNRQAGLAALEANRQAQIAQQQNQMTGSLLGAVGEIGSSYANKAWADNQKAEAYKATLGDAYKNENAAQQYKYRGDNIINAGGGSIFNTSQSDETTKTNKAPAEKKMKSFLDALSAQSYNYKPETGLDTRKKYGIMAQDLEKSEVGKSLVVEKNGVKHVDMDRGFSAILAAQAELNERLNSVEKKKS